MEISLEHISKTFGDKQVFRSFSLTLPETGCVALLGPSGCGKTTLLRLLSGLERPDDGKAILLESGKTAYLFQEDRLLPAFTARENIMAVLRNRQVAGRLLANQWLARVGLAGEEDAYPASLSGGMKRRVAIARALAFGGELLLLDEPFKGLDLETRTQLQELVLTGHDARRRLTVLVTHDVEEALAYADKILLVNGLPFSIADTVSVDIPVSQRAAAQDVLVWHREYIKRKLTGKRQGE